MNPLNLIGAAALIASGFCLFDGRNAQEAGATLDANAVAMTDAWVESFGVATDAGLLACVIEADAVNPNTSALAVGVPHAASLAPWFSVASGDYVDSPSLTVAFTIPEPKTLTVLVGVVAAAILRRTRCQTT